MNFHLIWSSWFSSSCVSCSNSQRVKYSWMWSSVSPRVLLMSRIQVFCCSASATVLFFRRQIANRLGAISFGLRPCSHPECQKLVFLPLPIEIVVHAANRRRSMSSHGIAVPIQALNGNHVVFGGRYLEALMSRIWDKNDWKIVLLLKVPEHDRFTATKLWCVHAVLY